MKYKHLIDRKTFKSQEIVLHELLLEEFITCLFHQLNPYDLASFLKQPVNDWININ